MNTENFRAALRAAGLDYGGPIVTDGRLHRFRAEGDHARNSWFVLHTGTPMAGAFGCWRRGFKETWCAGNGGLSQAEWQDVRRRWQDAERERERTEAGRREKARQTAAWILARAKPVQSHGYLERKGVNAFGGVREYRGALALPLRDADGELHSLQFIGADGGKRFLSGGRVAGCFFTVADKADGTLVICEGFATGASVHEATGLATVAGMNAGNLLAVAKSLREKFPSRELIVAADNDQWTDGNPGLAKATEAALAIGAKLAVPTFIDVTMKPTDYNDLHQLQGLDIVKAQIEAATRPTETDEQVIARLAALPPLAYERQRDAAAERLGCRTSILDKLVAAQRPRSDSDTQEQAQSILPQAEPQPWPESVDGIKLLDSLVQTLNRFAVFAPHAAAALALVVLETYAAEHFDAAPYVHLSSPEKRCGKSLVMRLLAKLCARALPAGPCSESAIFRAIAATTPTLLIDEVDSFFAERDELRGILNVGNVRDDASVMRSEEVTRDGKRTFEPRRYSVFCPKVFAGIGKLADTLADRCIPIPMHRKRADEKRERFRRRDFDAGPLRQQCRRWAEDHAEALAASRPTLPEQLNDRAADLWEPLLAVADAAGGHWPERARAAAVGLSGETENCTTGSLGALLLADIQTLFSANGVDRFSSVELCEKLKETEERPWGEIHHGKPITPNRLSRLLAPYRVSSRKVRLPSGTKQGYTAADFADAWDRYCPGLSNRNNGTRPVNVEDSCVFETEQPDACSTTKTAEKPNDDRVCSVVPLQKAVGVELVEADML